MSERKLTTQDVKDDSWLSGPMWSDPELRYYRDAMFRHAVDTLEALVVQAQLTPSEIREAAVLACTHHEMRTVRLRPLAGPGWPGPDGTG